MSESRTPVVSDIFVPSSAAAWTINWSESPPPSSVAVPAQSKRVKRLTDPPPVSFTLAIFVSVTAALSFVPMSAFPVTVQSPSKAAAIVFVPVPPSKVSAPSTFVIGVFAGIVEPKVNGAVGRNVPTAVGLSRFVCVVNVSFPPPVFTLKLRSP